MVFLELALRPPILAIGFPFRAMLRRAVPTFLADVFLAAAFFAVDFLAAAVFRAAFFFIERRARTFTTGLLWVIIGVPDCHQLLMALAKLCRRSCSRRTAAKRVEPPAKEV